MAGRSLPHAMLMMIPEPWQNNDAMDPSLRAFYEYHASLMEPWDGPASLAFTDGTVIGAVLDRNGLRPSRYYVTKDDLVVMASEVGVLDIPPGDVVMKERLHPGRIFLVDTAQGRIISDEEIKRELAREYPYAEWLQEHLIPIEEVAAAPYLPAPDHATVLRRQQAFGYTQEDIEIILRPMALGAEEPLGSMGTDTPLAVLSQRPRLLYDYFKQLFAQVTNPPLDAIREELVTSMESTIGPERNLLKPEPRSCRQIVIKYPIIDNESVAKVRHTEVEGFRSVTLPMLYPAAEGGAGLERALDRLREQAQEAVLAGHTVIFLSDRGVNATQAPIPSLLATAGVHHHLVREGLRTRCALVVETGDAREVHHMALLIGYGAGAVNPYLAFETLGDMIQQRAIEGVAHEKAVLNYIKGLNKGILKVMSKMGISTLQSYCGAQIFEAIGLDKAFVDRYFTWTASRIGGADINVIAREVRERHRRAFPPRNLLATDLETGGEYKWRRDGELHLFNPETVHKLQHATRSGQYAIYKEYTAIVNDQSRNLGTLRGLLEFRPTPTPIPLDEVEPVEAILKRFATGAMSYGSISQEAHETIAIAMNRLGAKSNTGEGGEDSARYRPDANGDSRRSAIKQVASARFGVTSEYLVNADDLQIKMAQGAKPGEGGQLPGHKVYPWIAKVRHSTPGVTLISPPPHHDIYSIEDLAQLIYDLKNANHLARVHVKLVAEVGVGTVAAGVAKAHADVVLISGHDGGTGASPLTSIKHAGVPWELGLAETQQVLVLNKLRDRIVVQADGQLPHRPRRGRGGAARCRRVRLFDRGAGGVGLHHDARLPPQYLPGRRRHPGSGAPQEVHRQARVRRELLPLRRRGRARADGGAGIPHHGRDDRPLRSARDAGGGRALEGLRRRSVADPPPARRPRQRGAARGADPGSRARASAGQPASSRWPLPRSSGASRSRSGCRFETRTAPSAPCSVRKSRGVTAARGCPTTPSKCSSRARPVRASARSCRAASRCAWKGIPTISGARGCRAASWWSIRRRQSTFASHENVIVGNVCLYGATSGEAYVRGIAGERFAVRNSGALAVVEGVGDHGCEYMTGGPGGRDRPDRPQLRGRHERRGRVCARRRRPVRPPLQPGAGRARAARPRRIWSSSGRCCAVTCATPTAAARCGCSPTGSTSRPASSRSFRATTSACCWPRRARDPRTASRCSRSWWGRPMGNPNGFIQIKRTKPHARPVDVRVRDWHEVYLSTPEKEVRDQGARCMDCGIPFCHQGCPLGNQIPEWNDLVYRHRWQAAIDRLHATNNFPDFTGRLCPAPCEGSCVLGINDDPVTIKNIELSIVERAFDEGWIRATPPAMRTGKRVAVVGSGPAGLAAADQLNKAGHFVTVFEKSDRIGGLLRYGIPEFKIEKRLVNRRLALLEAEGIEFRAGVNVGVDIPASALRRDFDAIVLCGGAGAAARPAGAGARARQASISPSNTSPSRTAAARETAVPEDQVITAAGKRVIIIGGGDTGADCLGTAHRQGARVGAPVRAAAAPAGGAGGRQSLAAVAAHLPQLRGARRRRRAPVLDLHRAVRRRRDRAGAGAGDDRRRREPVGRDQDSRHRAGDRRRSRAPGDGLRRAGTRRADLRARGPDDRTRQRLARRAVDDQRRRRVRRRRHAARAIADRLGHRRRPARRRCRGYLSDGRIEPLGDRLTRVALPACPGRPSGATAQPVRVIKLSK